MKDKFIVIADNKKYRVKADYYQIETLTVEKISIMFFDKTSTKCVFTVISGSVVVYIGSKDVQEFEA